MPSGNKPSPQPILVNFYNSIMASLEYIGELLCKKIDNIELLCKKNRKYTQIHF